MQSILVGVLWLLRVHGGDELLPMSEGDRPLGPGSGFSPLGIL